MDMSQRILSAAITMAAVAHAQQTYNDLPYITHPLRVMLRCTESLDAMIVAVLHDVVEDSFLTMDNISDVFPPHIVAAIDAITKRDDESYDAYLARLSENPLAYRVKCADVIENYSHLPYVQSDSRRAKLQAKYDHAMHVLDIEWSKTF